MLFSLHASCVPVHETADSVPPHKVKTTAQRICLLLFLVDGWRRINRPLFSHPLSDGYSTIDQRDKDCKYKTVDGSVDQTEREPLKVQAHLLPGGGAQDEITVSR